MGAPAVSAHPLPSGAIRTFGGGVVKGFRPTILLVLFSSVFLREMEEGKSLPEDAENIERFLREKNEEKKEMNNVFDFINLFLMWNIIYFHVSGHMSADQLISAVETGSITGVNMTKELIEALKSVSLSLSREHFYNNDNTQKN